MCLYSICGVCVCLRTKTASLRVVGAIPLVVRSKNVVPFMTATTAIRECLAVGCLKQLPEQVLPQPAACFHWRFDIHSPFELFLLMVFCEVDPSIFTAQGRFNLVAWHTPGNPLAIQRHPKLDDKIKGLIEVMSTSFEAHVSTSWFFNGLSQVPQVVTCARLRSSIMQNSLKWDAVCVYQMSKTRGLPSLGLLKRYERSHVSQTCLFLICTCLMNCDYDESISWDVIFYIN